MTFSSADISFEPQSGYLVIRVHSRCIIDTTEDAFEFIASAIAERPVKAVLVDVRPVPGPFTFLHRVKLGEATGRYLTGTPIAAVLTEEQADPERIGRLIARNRGANVEIFIDPTEAMAWVQKYLG